jgi:flagellar basal body-associated protein FliL
MTDIVKMTNNQDSWMSYALKLEAKNERLRAEIERLRALIREMLSDQTEETFARAEAALAAEDKP